MKDCHLYC